MTLSRKGVVGLLSLGVLAAASAGYPLFSAFLPPCPFGADLVLPEETVCARTFGGMWRSLAVGLLAGGASAGLGLLFALLARRFGGAADLLVAKAADLFFSIPDVLVLVAIGFAASVWGDAHGTRPSPFWLMVFSLSAVGWAAPTRMIQNRLRSLEGQEFVAAAFALGASRFRVVTRHLLPFAREYVFAIFLLRVPATILAESTVSFLGFGMPPDHPSLGTYLGQSYRFLLDGEWRIVGPAWALLVLTVLGFSWTGQLLLDSHAKRSGARGR